MNNTRTRAGPKPPWSPERGQWLREERRKRGIKAEALGEAIGVSGFRIYELERAFTSRGPTGPSHDQLQVIRDVLARSPVIVEPQRPPANGKTARLTIEIDEGLMNAALTLSGSHTKKAVVEEALDEYVRHRAIDKLRDMIGTYEIDLTPEELRRMRGRE